eukprot:g899.t1
MSSKDVVEARDDGAHPEMVRPTIPKSGHRRRRSVKYRRKSGPAVVSSVEEIISEAKTFSRGWFKRQYKDKDGEALEKKIEPLKTIPTSLKRLARGPIRMFGRKAAVSTEHLIEVVGHIKGSMYSCTGYPEKGDSMPSQGSAIGSMMTAFMNADRSEQKFVKSIGNSIESFCKASVRSTEELDLLLESRSAFAQNYYKTRAEYDDVLDKAKKKRGGGSGWFGKKKATSADDKNMGEPEDDADVVAARKRTTDAGKRLQMVNQVVNDKIAAHWIEKEKLLSSTLRNFAIAHAARCQKILNACEQCLGALPSDGCIEQFYNPEKYGSGMLPPLSHVNGDGVSCVEGSSSFGKPRLATPNPQYQKRVKQLAAMGFSERFCHRAIKEAKGDMESAVTLLLANKKAGKLFGMSRNSVVSTGSDSGRGGAEVGGGVKRILAPPLRKFSSRPPSMRLGQASPGKIAREAASKARERKSSAKSAAEVGDTKEMEEAANANERLYERLKTMCKGKRRASTYTKVRDALVEEFGADTFVANKARVQEFLRTGGKGVPPTVPKKLLPSSEPFSKPKLPTPRSKSNDDAGADEDAAEPSSKSSAADDDDVRSFSVDTLRIGLVVRDDGVILWRRRTAAFGEDVSPGDQLVRAGEVDVVASDAPFATALRESTDRPLKIVVRSGKGADFDAATRGVPLLLVECIAYLRAHGMKVDGIFRKNGNLGMCTELQKSFIEEELGNVTEAPDLEKVLAPDDGSVRTVASLLKMYFRLREEPLIPGTSYEKVVACGSDANALKTLFNDGETLPPENYEVLANLVPFLLQVTQHSDTNRMTAKALGICWSQSLMRTPVDDESNPQEAMLKIAMDTAKCNVVVEALIANASDIFGARPGFYWI